MPKSLQPEDPAWGAQYLALLGARAAGESAGAQELAASGVALNSFRALYPLDAGEFVVMVAGCLPARLGSPSELELMLSGGSATDHLLDGCFYAAAPGAPWAPAPSEPNEFAEDDAFNAFERAVDYRFDGGVLRQLGIVDNLWRLYHVLHGWALLTPAQRTDIQPLCAAVSSVLDGLPG